MTLTGASYFDDAGCSHSAGMPLAFLTLTLMSVQSVSQRLHDGRRLDAEADMRIR